MEGGEDEIPNQQKWKKVAYGGMHPGYDDNYTDETFLEDMVMNANVVKRDFVKVIQDSISISQYLCIVTLVVCIWIHTLSLVINELTLLKLDFCLIALGFSVLSVITNQQLNIQLLLRYVLIISFFISGLYILAPIYHTLTRSISSDSIWALTASLLLIHLFLHDYSGALKNPTFASNVSLNSSIAASVLVASRLPSSLHVFAIMLFSLQVFLFAPQITFCIKKYCNRLYLLFSFVLVSMALGVTYQLHRMLFSALSGLLIFVSVVCPYWLIRVHEYKFEINGPWDEAKLCFDITE